MPAPYKRAQRPIARMHPMAILMLACSIATLTTAQIQVDWSIIPPPNQNTIDLSNLGQEAANQGATGIVSVDKIEETQLTASMCQPGTYSKKTSATAAQICVPCPAGTASATVGASDPSTCIPCLGGAWSNEQSSACTDCADDKFSVTVRATTPDVCMQCPPDSTSPARSSNVDMCICDNGNFLSDNIMKVLPYDTVSIDMSVVGVTAIDIPHVTC
jgi:hypothetical protein